MDYKEFKYHIRNEYNLKPHFLRDVNHIIFEDLILDCLKKANSFILELITDQFLPDWKIYDLANNYYEELKIIFEDLHIEVQLYFDIKDYYRESFLDIIDAALEWELYETVKNFTIFKAFAFEIEVTNIQERKYKRDNGEL